jgi:hypothetical protein
MLSDGLSRLPVRVSPPFIHPVTMPIPTLMRSATREPSVEALLLRLETLTRERQDLRQGFAEAPTLEQNRLAIVEAQWDLSRALIRRYLPAAA